MYGYLHQTRWMIWSSHLHVHALVEKIRFIIIASTKSWDETKEINTNVYVQVSPFKINISPPSAA